MRSYISKPDEGILPMTGIWAITRCIISDIDTPSNSAAALNLASSVSSFQVKINRLVIKPPLVCIHDITLFSFCYNEFSTSFHYPPPCSRNAMRYAKGLKICPVESTECPNRYQTALFQLL